MADDNDPLPAWNAAFLDMFRRTRAYDDWDRRTDEWVDVASRPAHEANCDCSEKRAVRPGRPEPPLCGRKVAVHREHRLAARRHAQVRPSRSSIAQSRLMKGAQGLWHGGKAGRQPSGHLEGVGQLLEDGRQLQAERPEEVVQVILRLLTLAPVSLARAEPRVSRVA